MKELTAQTARTEQYMYKTAQTHFLFNHIFASLSIYPSLEFNLSALSSNFWVKRGQCSTLPPQERGGGGVEKEASALLFLPRKCSSVLEKHVPCVAASFWRCCAERQGVNLCVNFCQSTSTHTANGVYLQCTCGCICVCVSLHK